MSIAISGLEHVIQFRTAVPVCMLDALFPWENIKKTQTSYHQPEQRDNPEFFQHTLLP